MSGPPVIAWLGRAPPSELSRQLGRLAWVRPGWQRGARIAALWGDSDLSLLGQLPDGNDRPPVVVACEDHPPPEVRRRWEAAGADQVIALDALVPTLREWLEGPARAEHADDPPTFNPGGGPFADEVEPSLTVLSGPVYVDQADPFPPLRLGDGQDEGTDGVRRYVLALDRYLERREEVVRLMGEDGLTRFLELTHLREQVPMSLAGGRQRLDPYGRGRQVEAPDWKVIVRRMKPRTREIEASEGRLYAIGTDGVVLVTLFAAGPRQRLLVDLPLEPQVNVQFIYEARWQRRIGARRWHVGALLVEMRRRNLDGSPT